MCGICGIYNFKKEEVDEKILKNMLFTFFHRGPDEEGIFLEENIGLGSRRLSIIDLQTGTQPVYNEDKSIILLFNGEIYNFEELREGLQKKGHKFYTKSDTEVIVHLYEDYKEEVLKYLRGMFAFALWDKKKKQLFLARDRLGIKPLYYFKNGDIFIFASEIKAILQHPQVGREVNINSLHNYLTYLYDPSDHTMFLGIKKLPPSHFLQIKNNEIEISRYWRWEVKIEEKKENVVLTELESIFKEAIKLHLISDVPLGVFLSGGIDSSLLVGMICHLTNNKVKTFSIGFEGAGYYNELPFARKVAKQYGTEHFEFIVKPSALKILPKLVWYLDEPLADASVIPNYYVSEVAKKLVKVSISGLGGDELFGGYLRHLGNKIFRYYALFPPLFKDKLLPYLIKRLPSSGHTRIQNFFRLMKKFIEGASLLEDIRYIKWNIFFDEDMKKELYQEELLQTLGKVNSIDLAKEYFNEITYPDFILKAQNVDIKTYLPGDLLFLTDRMTMANSIEGRVPFLDHYLLEFSGRLPSRFKIRGLTTKYILRKLSEKYLPQEIVSREKHGFAIPIDIWFRGELKGILKKIFKEENIKKGFFKKEYIDNLFAMHNQGKEDLSQHIWALIIFDVWYRIFIENKTKSEPDISLNDMY